jgi:Mn2+/Fe2+ NRAMP family transporter
MKVDVVRMLFWASILNGLFAPVCILLVVKLTSSTKVMANRASCGWLCAGGWIAFLTTAAAAIALVITTAI